MKIFITALFFTILCANLSAQHVIDLSRLDYIDVGTRKLEGYIENRNGKYTSEDEDGNIINGEKYAICEYEGTYEGMDSIRISDFDEDSMYGDVMKVSDIPTMSIANWEALLNKQDLIWDRWGNYEKDKDAEKLNLLIKESPYAMQAVELSYNEGAFFWFGNDYEVRNRYDSIRIADRYYNTANFGSQLDINYIKLKGNKYLLCLSAEDDFYKFIPNKEKQNPRLAPIKLDKELQSKKLSQDSERNASSKFTIRQYKGGRHFIANQYGLPIGIVGDSIVTCDEGPIAVYDKASNNYALYDPFLNKVKHNYKIRYVKADSKGFLTLLIGNKLLVMSGDSISSTFVLNEAVHIFCGTVNSYKDKIVYDADGTIKLERIVDGRMVARGMNYNSYDITNAQEIDSLYFEGQESKFNYSDNTSLLLYSAKNKSLRSAMVRAEGEQQLLYGKMKNGKYNLFTYKTISSEVYKETKVENIPMEEQMYNMSDTIYYRGQMELQPLFPRDVDSLTMSGHLPLVYKEGGLSGVFPLHAKARYTSLKTKGDMDRLIRYQLPSGKEGWLDLDTGEELEDIVK